MLSYAVLIPHWSKFQMTLLHMFYKLRSLSEINEAFFVSVALRSNAGIAASIWETTKRVHFR